MRDAGAVITTTEAALFELSVRADTNEFKQILELIKDMREVIRDGKILCRPCAEGKAYYEEKI